MKSFLCQNSIFDKYLRVPTYLSHDKASAVEKRIGKSKLTICIFWTKYWIKKPYGWISGYSLVLCSEIFSFFKVCIFSITRSKICETGQKTACCDVITGTRKINPCQTKTSKLLITKHFFKGGETMSKWFLSVSSTHALFAFWAQKYSLQGRRKRERCYVL